MTLGVGTIRGVESRGMLVSEFELQISDDHEGIIELPDDAPVGASYAKWAGLDDPVIEINLTPNRADCTGVHGIARDLAAADMGKLKDDRSSRCEGRFPCPVKVTLDFGATPSLCPAFALRLVRGVKNGPSPDWLQRRLDAIGLRPINALVDITNFITYDRGRPLHVFDAAKVHGNLTVRRAREGESLLALDGKTYALDETICVIADEQGRRIARRHHGRRGHRLLGDDHRRADRIGAVGPAQHRADRPQARHQFGRALPLRARRRSRLHGAGPRARDQAMVLDLCGGEPSEVTVAGKPEAPERVIDFPLDEVPRLAGLEVAAEIKRVLGALGFFVAGEGERVKVAVPSWRADVEGKADLVEEVVRIVGVDRVPATPFDRGEAPRKPVLTPIQLRTRKAKRARRARHGRGGDLVVHRQAAGRAVRRRQARACARQSDRRRPLRHAAEPDPGPVAAAQKNADRGFPDVALFEVGQIFRATSRRIRSPPPAACAARWPRRPAPAATGRHRRPRSMRSTPRPMRSRCWRRRRADAGAAGRAGRAGLVPPRPLRHDPDRAAERARPFRRAASARARSARRRRPAGRLRGDPGKDPEAKAKATRAKPVLELSPFQPVERDFAFVVDRTVKAGDIVRAAQNVDRKLITSVTVFDVYEGKGIEPGKKSIAIAVTLQPREKTMTDQEIEAVAGKIVAEVGKRTGGVLRA